MNADHFIKRAKKLIAAGVKPRCVTATEDGKLIDFVYDPLEAFQTPAFFTDVEPPGKTSLMVAFLSEEEFAKTLYRIADEMKGPVRIAGVMNKQSFAVDHWAIQFANTADLNRALNSFRSLDRNYGISITFDPNQKDPT